MIQSSLTWSLPYISPKIEISIHDISKIRWW